MFDSIEENYKLIFTAYKKLKSYYYYEKNNVFVREKIAAFEYDEIEMNKRMQFLAKLLANPANYQTYIESWIAEIDYYVMPKGFKEEKQDERFITGAESKTNNRVINKVNFFINIPIELHLLETVWTLVVGKLTYDNSIISKDSYGNSINYPVVYNRDEETVNGIIYGKNQLFKLYYPQYCLWKNRVIDVIEKYKNNVNMVLLSLDIKSFFYSVKWNFDKLTDFFELEEVERIAPLTDVIRRMYCQYTMLIARVRIINQDLASEECVLPIGLFSSMVIANIYLSRFDKEMDSKKDILYYGRYVDDILILINRHKTNFECNDEATESLTRELGILELADGTDYSIYGYPNLIIQKEKMKVFFFEKGKADSLFNQLKATERHPSQMNVVPNDDLKMLNFDEDAYAVDDLDNGTKIRDFGQIEINRLRLGQHLAALVRSCRFDMKSLNADVRLKRQSEIDKVKSFFVCANALEFSGNWNNALYFMMVGENNSSKSSWKEFERNIRDAIKNVRVSKPEEIVPAKVMVLKKRMREQLNKKFNICVATALALNPEYYKKEAKEIIDLSYKIRKANLFNHKLVAYPLANYIDDLPNDVDLTNEQSVLQLSINFDLLENRKVSVSPRFISLDELFVFDFYECKRNAIGWEMTSERMENTRDVFFKINNINTEYAKPFNITIGKESVFDDSYVMENVTIPKTLAGNTGVIKIAVANLKMTLDDCCKGLRGNLAVRDRSKFLDLLREAHEYNVHFLVFPEFYMPVEWMNDVLDFVKKTGITVISGMQYITVGDKAYNMVAVYSQFSSGKYKNSFFLLREKNDYAPEEIKILALKGYSCRERRKKPLYTLVDNGEIKYGMLLCYEFTDIMARALYKNRTDLLFTPENNRDTGYFSNILETTTRDLHTFIIQANNSLYGDSRIIGPYDRNHRNIIQIKGGENDEIIIGYVNVREIRKGRQKERNESAKNLDKIRRMNNAERKKDYKEIVAEESKATISKLSARTDY